MGRDISRARCRALVLVVIATIASLGWTSAVAAVEFWPKTFVFKRKGNVALEPSVATLAEEIDWLERHIDAYGTVVAKEPDVWGEARLTKHRQEYEEIMMQRLTAFAPQYSAAIQRSDAAYLGFAMALSAASGGQPLNNPASNLISTPAVPGTGNPQTNDTDQLLPRTGAFGLGTNANSKFTFGGDTTISLEPNVVNDEWSDYLNHLHELRRINEGDDTADAPGYSLNLVRIPISILTGKKTRKACGAEITISATPYLGEELLPVTFRSLVVNDVVDQLVQPLYMMVLKHDRDVLVQVRKQFQISLQHAGYAPPTDFEELVVQACAACDDCGVCNGCQQFLVLKVLNRHDIPRKITRETMLLVEKAIADCTAVCAPLDVIADDNCGADCNCAVSLSAKARRRGGAALRTVSNHAHDEPALQKEHPLTPPPKDAAPDETPEVVDPPHGQIHTESQAGPLNSAPSAGPIAQSQVLRLYNTAELGQLAEQLAASLPDHNYRETLLDIYLWLRGETAAAYEMVAVHPANLQDYPGRAPAIVIEQDAAVVPEIPTWSPETVRELQRFLWGGSFLKELAEAIRSNNMHRAQSLHQEFRNALRRITDCERISMVTDLLAWGVTYDSAVLNEQLVRDIRETSSLKGCGCMQQTWLPFYGPDPPPEARQAFNQYVGCRWPLHIFALDPVIDQQNIQDSFSRRREMQLALSMGFMAGQVGPGAMMNYGRRLEWDMATVALNRTIVGFSHGGSTFGWRFMPRFQTPDIKGTLETLAQLVAGGPSRDCDRCDLELEEGMRECAAIVLMPSFVPAVVFETRSNWYRLTNPKKTALSMEQTVRLSRSVKTMQMAQEGISDEDLYRDGELARMMTRVRQLSEELPMQTLRVEVPIDNFESGAEILAHGRAELMPVLYGWYGAPGVKLGEKTTVFLLGKNFSIHETVITVGNVAVSGKLLSRNIMQLTIPDNVRPVIDPTSGQPDFVDLHLATPYGVTAHVEIPVVGGCPDGPVSAPLEWTTETRKVLIRYKNAPTTATPPIPVLTAQSVGFDAPPSIIIRAPVAITPTTVKAQLWLTDANSQPSTANGTTSGGHVISGFVSVDARFDVASKTYRVEGPNFAALTAEMIKSFNTVYVNQDPTTFHPGPWYLNGTIAADANSPPALIQGAGKLEITATLVH